VCVLVDLGYTLLTSSDCGGGVDAPAPEWLEVLSLISTVITTLFLVEIPLTLWSLGFEFYDPRGQVTHAGLHVFDAVIIVTTFVLEVVLRGKERELAGLLVILRLWRLLKLVGGEYSGCLVLEMIPLLTL
jgi:voltage-gated hydrogen channel 1